MVVGQHQAIGRDDNARAKPAALTGTAAHFRTGLDAHHGGADALGHIDHGIGIGIEQDPVIVRLGRSRWQIVIGDI
jgi:hypothetical protein